MSGKYPPATAGDIIKVLNKLGFSELKNAGSSHKQFRKDNQGKKVTVPDHGKNVPLAKKTFKSILSQMSLEKDEFYQMLNS